MPAALPGQAMVEYGLGAAAAGTAGAANQSAGKGIAGIMSNLGKVLDSATKAQPAAAATAPAPAAKAPAAAPAPPKPAVTYEDPGKITAGLDSAELLQRFGEPAMKVTSGGGRESLTYETKERRWQIEVRDGKVESVESKRRAKQSAVVILQ
jgi:hypothetical protein